MVLSDQHYYYPYQPLSDHVPLPPVPQFGEKDPKLAELVLLHPTLTAPQ
jgi:hypothetical protein